MYDVVLTGAKLRELAFEYFHTTEQQNIGLAATVVIGAVAEQYNTAVALTILPTLRVDVPHTDELVDLLSYVRDGYTEVFGFRAASQVVKAIIRKACQKWYVQVRKLVPRKGSQSPNLNTYWVRTGETKKSIGYKIVLSQRFKAVLGILGAKVTNPVNEVKYRKRIFYKKETFEKRFIPSERRIADRKRKERKTYGKMWEKVKAGKLVLKKYHKPFSGMLRKIHVYKTSKRTYKRVIEWKVKRKHVPFKIWHLVDLGFENTKAKQRVSGRYYTNRGMTDIWPEIKKAVNEVIQKKTEHYLEKTRQKLDFFERRRAAQLARAGSRLK